MIDVHVHMITDKTPTCTLSCTPNQVVNLYLGEKINVYMQSCIHVANCVYVLIFQGAILCNESGVIRQHLLWPAVSFPQ